MLKSALTYWASLMFGRILEMVVAILIAAVIIAAVVTLLEVVPQGKLQFQTETAEGQSKVAERQHAEEMRRIRRKQCCMIRRLGATREWAKAHVNTFSSDELDECFKMLLTPANCR